MKSKNTADPTGTFFPQVCYLAKSAGISGFQMVAEEVQSAATKNFSQTFSDILSGQFVAPGTQLRGITLDLVISYQCRNKSAHSIEPFARSYGDVMKILYAVFHTLFMVVETLF